MIFTYRNTPKYIILFQSIKLKMYVAIHNSKKPYKL